MTAIVTATAADNRVIAIGAAGHHELLVAEVAHASVLNAITAEQLLLRERMTLEAVIDQLSRKV
ncbi:MAG TPA: hypothetical protein VF223_18905 [Trebonia sp.]